MDDLFEDNFEVEEIQRMIQTKDSWGSNCLFAAAATNNSSFLEKFLKREAANGNVSH